MDNIFGTINQPPGVSTYCTNKGHASDVACGLIPFLSNIVKFIIVIGGLYAFFNIIMAGYGFLSAGDDPKKMAAAWAKIWQSLLGLLIVAGAFVITAIVSYLVFGNTTAILNPQIYTANQP